MSMNPFCLNALEESVLLKEAKKAQEVIAVTIGSKAYFPHIFCREITQLFSCQKTLETALAIGADKAIHVVTEERTDLAVQPLLVAKILKNLTLREKINLVLLGQQAIDDDYNQTGQILAALLGWPQATFASKINIEGDKVQVNRENDAGVQTVRKIHSLRSPEYSSSS